MTTLLSFFPSSQETCPLKAGTIPPLPPGCTIIYAPKGEAGEYAKAGANPGNGCFYQCGYCYGPGATRTTREHFSEFRPKKNFLARLEKDAAKMEQAGCFETVWLSFTCDPCQPSACSDPEEFDPLDCMYLTTQAVKILNSHNIPVCILTKGGNNSRPLLEVLRGHPDNWYGCTLVFTDEEKRKYWEPNAAPTPERIKVLKEAFEMGIHTHVSMEPCFYMDQTLELIDITHEFVDMYRIGALNHFRDPDASRIDKKILRQEAVKKFEKYGNKYYVKKSLQGRR